MIGVSDRSSRQGRHVSFGEYGRPDGVVAVVVVVESSALIIVVGGLFQEIGGIRVKIQCRREFFHVGKEIHRVIFQVGQNISKIQIALFQDLLWIKLQGRSFSWCYIVFVDFVDRISLGIENFSQSMKCRPLGIPCHLECMCML